MKYYLKSWKNDRKTKNSKWKDRKTKIAIKTERQKKTKRTARLAEKLARKTEKIVQQPKNNDGKTKKIAGEEGPCTFYGCSDWLMILHHSSVWMKRQWGTGWWWSERTGWFL